MEGKKRSQKKPKGKIKKKVGETKKMNTRLYTTTTDFIVIIYCTGKKNN